MHRGHTGFPPQNPIAPSATRVIQVDCLVKKVYIERVLCIRIFMLSWNFFKAPESENKTHFVGLSVTNFASAKWQTDFWVSGNPET